MSIDVQGLYDLFAFNFQQLVLGVALSPSLNLRKYQGICVVQPHVYPFSGGPSTCDISLQDSADGSSNWVDILTFTQATDLQAVLEQLTFNTENVRQFVRMAYVAAGTGPAFIVEAHVLLPEKSRGPANLAANE